MRGQRAYYHDNDTPGDYALAYRHKKTARPRTEGSVYFMRAGEYIKIGFTTNVVRRLDQINRLFPGTVFLAIVPNVTGELESELHQAFGRFLAYKREYYHPVEEIMNFIEQLKTRGIAE